MTTLGPSMKPMIMPHYPHMLAEDIVVWTDFLKANGPLIKEVWYDVKCGSAMSLPVGATDIQRAVAMGVSRKRIDVVAHVGNEYWVVEVKPYGNMVAFGQVMAYSRLFASEYEVDGPVIPCVVCSKVDRDLVDDFAGQGVLVFEVSTY